MHFCPFNSNWEADLSKNYDDPSIFCFEIVKDEVVSAIIKGVQGVKENLPNEVQLISKDPT